MFLDPTKFEIIAGHDVVESMREAYAKRVRITAGGYGDSEDICELQREEARRGLLGVEIVHAFAGASVRYDSGLQDFGLVASSYSLGGTIEEAEAFARNWVAADPGKRYAWKRI